MFSIAWIDDDIDVLEAVVEPIEKDRDQYRIRRIKGVAEARDPNNLKLILGEDLILLDILGPAGKEREDRYPGLELLKELVHAHHSTVPVICFSVSRRPEVMKELRELKVVDILRKPILPSELKRKVDEVLAAR